MSETNGTRSNRTGEPGTFKCAAMVDYRGRKGACRRDGKHPDIDGIRWWCGLHDPSKKAKKKAETAPADTVETVETSASSSARPRATLQPAYEGDGKIVGKEVLLSATQAQVADAKALQALEDAQMALIEIANTNTAHWDESVPVDNFKVIIAHMADGARAASVKLTAVLRDLKS